MSIFVKKKVVNCQDIPRGFREKLYEQNEIYSNNSYFTFYPCDGYYKPISEANDIKNMVDVNDEHGYEKGDDPVSDWFLENGVDPCEDVIILVNW